MVTVFAREITDDLASLVRKIDEQVGKHKDEQLSAFVVLLTDDPDEAEAKLKKLAEKHDLDQDVPLTVFDGEAGPPSYKISKDADVTVLLWRRTDVKVNHAFAKGEFDKKAVDRVVSDIPKILE